MSWARMIRAVKTFETDFLFKRLRCLRGGGWRGVSGGSELSRLPLEHGSVRPQTLPKRVSDDPWRFIFRRQNHQNFAKFSQTLDGRLPPEDGSNLAETWPKHVSDDPRHFIFRLPDFFSVKILIQKCFFFSNKKNIFCQTFSPKKNFRGLKYEMSGIVWNVFWPSFKPIGAILAR